MKKTILTIILVVLSLTTIYAQLYIDIGDETSTSTNRDIPTNGYYDYSWSNYILTSNQIGQAIDINELLFNITNTPSSFAMENQQVYMKLTSDSQITATYPDPANNGFTLVFDGSVTWNDSGWQGITLDTEFSYDGASNLQIVWINNDASWSEGYPFFLTTETTINTSAVKYYDESFPSSNGNLRYYYPNTRLGFYEEGFASSPTIISPTNNSFNNLLTTELVWTIGDNTEFIHLYLSDERNDVIYNAETALVLTGGLVTSFSPNLEIGTRYYWKVVASNSNSPFISSTDLHSFSTSWADNQGIGSPEDPYLVDEFSDLIYISEVDSLWNKHFMQTADIDASISATLNEGAGFSPIGNNDLNFTGSYNGANHTISNLYINRPSQNYIGLFGVTSTANISNLGIVDNETHGSTYSSGLVGKASSSTIHNSYTSGNMSGGQFVGGLVGFAYATAITNSYTTGSVSGTSYDIGGLVGRLDSYSSITNSYTTGSVSGGAEVGGLVGFAYAFNTSISNSYVSGTVSGSHDVGGLVGKGNIAAANSFWDIETSGQTSSTAGTGLTSQAMTSIYTYINAGWDFLGEDVNGSDDIWYIHPSVNSGYPQIIPAQENIIYYLPLYALSSYPNDGVTNLATSDNLVWQADLLQLTTGYRLNLGTDNPPTNVTNNENLGLTTLYNSNNLAANTTYYWQVIPYNANGDAEDCPIWSFTTGTTEILNVGRGDNSNQALPFNFIIQKNYSQSIYLQSELNLSNRNIEKIAFYLTDDLITAGAKQWKIYLGHTDKTAFTTNNDWLLSDDGLLEVADITLSDNLSTGWNDITLDAPFAYNNIDNLIVGVIEYSSGVVVNPVNFYTVETGNNRSIAYGHASETPEPNISYGGVLFTSIPKINFTFSESTTRFTGLVQNSQNQPLTNANIYIEEFGTFPTNALGEFNIHTVEAGTHQLTISSPWYETQTVEFEVLEAQDNYLEITLLEELLPANDVTATLASDLSNVSITWLAPALSRRIAIDKQEIERSGQPIVTYNLYRYELADADNQENWIEVATNINALTYTDDSLITLELGTYCWVVEAVYSNDRVALPIISNDVVYGAILESNLTESIHFGSIPFANSSELINLVLYNSGTITLDITDISIDDSNFSLMHDGQQPTIEAESYFIIPISFVPQSPGLHESNLIITNSSINKPNYSIILMGYGIDRPSDPENVEITLVDNNANITWDAVTEDIDQNPIIPDMYIIYYNGQNTDEEEDFYYLGISLELEYNHLYAGNFSEYMFYRVKAYIDVDDEVLSQINTMITQKGKVSQREIEGLIINSRSIGAYNN